MFAHTINARNVNQALGHGLSLLDKPGVVMEESRNGMVRVWPGPVITVTQAPCERIVFSPKRRANPFFHLFESLWMLGGRNDLPWVTQFNTQMKAYSDDGGLTQPAAYGHRWRVHFGYDQINAIVEELTANPTTRRAVLAMWDPGTARDNSVVIGDVDLYKAMSGSADVPCNTHCYFRINGGMLDMGVSCRSNDLLWGAHGANAVHFSVLMEYMAARIGVVVGTMYQFSWNYHLYEGVLKEPPSDVAKDVLEHDLYTTVGMRTTPMFHSGQMDDFDRELGQWLEWAGPEHDGGDLPPMLHPFLRGVATPMRRAWGAHKAKDYTSAVRWTQDIMTGDWQKASYDWMIRAASIYAEKENEL